MGCEVGRAAEHVEVHEEKVVGDEQQAAAASAAFERPARERREVEGALQGQRHGVKRRMLRPQQGDVERQQGDQHHGVSVQRSTRCETYWNQSTP